jgi:ornithine cyclodeaminase
MGSDTPVKQELDEIILERADLVVADSISQCRERGEISKALSAGCLAEEDIVELGQIIGTYRSKDQGSQDNARASEDQVTVADLTGVAVQDIQIATAVCRAADNDKKGATR